MSMMNLSLAIGDGVGGLAQEGGIVCVLTVCGTVCVCGTVFVSDVFVCVDCLFNLPVLCRIYRWRLYSAIFCHFVGN